MNEKKIALVTGGNKGLGLGTSRALARLGLRVLLASRDAHRGDEAAKSLRDEGLDVHAIALDVTRDDDVHAAKAFVEREHGGLDVLVNNAGILPDSSDPGARSVFGASFDTVRRGMETNFYGALRMLQAFVPKMAERGYGRVVNVSTGMAQLSDMNGGSPGYRTSKVAQNALTRIVHDETHKKGVLTNSVCPGWVKTDMGGPNAHRSIEQGVDTIVWCATLPNDGPSGGFFRDRKPIAW